MLIIFTIHTAIRLISFTFKKEVDDDGKAAVVISPASYEARLNKRMFDVAELEPELLRAGEALVLDATVSVLINN